MTISDIPITGLPDDTRVGTEAGSHDADSSAVDRSRMLQDQLDNERKAAMVSNLMVVLCGDNDAQPVLNTGTLYS